MLISFFETTAIEKKEFKEKLKGYTLQFFDETIQNVPYEKYMESDIISVFVHSTINIQTIKMCKKLKLVITRSTGTNHIDNVYLKSRNVILKNVPLYGENTVAEHTFALILSLSRKIHESYNKTISRKYSTDGLMGFDLKGKTIGIIGGGRIGLHVALMARSFGMHVRVYDIHEDKFLAELINFKYLSLNELLKDSDIISLHAPLNEQTIHMINHASISKMKTGVIIINTARGELIDTKDLIDGLETKKIAGAGLDVLEGEEFLLERNIFNSPIEKAAKIIIETNILTQMPNVIITPHNAFNSIEAIHRIINTTIANIEEQT